VHCPAGSSRKTSEAMNSSEETQRLVPKHGGYRKLKSFQAAQAVYDATVVFCDRFIDRRSRTHDQMVQAARSGLRFWGCSAYPDRKAIRPIELLP
jgi:hypothetical protein